MNYGSGYSGTANYAPTHGAINTGYIAGSTTYSAPSISSSYSMSRNHTMYAQPTTPHFTVTEGLLSENRPLTPIVSNMGEVKEIIERTYSIMTGEELPDEIKIFICDQDDFREMNPNPGVMGFSLNRYGKGTSEIYVKQDHMDKLLLTVGHEIGHVLSPTLPNAQDEEAKAHAFSLAWMETIRDNDIAGLQPNFAVNPARNGLHDVAFDFVTYLMQTGTTSYDIFKTLSQGLTSIIAER